jgi:hypothetical protein
MFKKRRPELAYQWYKRALGCYNSTKEKYSTEQIEQEKLLIKKKIQFLKSAKITPAK